jgi:hypothetical protein
MEDLAMQDWIRLIAVLGAVGWGFVGLGIVYWRLKAKDQGFGPRSLKAIGAVLLLSTIVLLAATTGFRSETLAALLGTVAGYVLSRGAKPLGNPTDGAAI